MTVAHFSRTIFVLSTAVFFTLAAADAVRASDLDDPNAPALSEAALHSLLTLARSGDPFENRSTAWWGYLGKQLDSSLNSSIDEIRHQALQLTITFAVRYPERINLRQAVPELAYIYTFERDSRYRVMALSAMHAIGGAYSMQMLSESAAHQTSGRVRALTNAALADFYAAN